MKRTLCSLILVLGFSASWAVEGRVADLKVDLRTDPPVIATGRAKLLVIVVDSEGKPVTDATVRAIARMPGMNMGEREETGRAAGVAGSYEIPAVFSMAGRYEVTLTINGKTGVIGLSTGQNTASAGAAPLWQVALPWLALLAGGAFVASRMRKTGQRVNLSGLMNRSVLGAVILLGGAAAVAVWAVRTQRREGAMTPIEAQVMEMNMPPPEGTVPVEVALVRSESFASTVRYAGQAVGYAEQDIVARVTGTVVWMPGYVGDPVAKGQVLAQLDTTALAPEVAMKSAALARARQGVRVSALEHEAARSETAQARAEAEVARREVGEAKAMIDAAKQAQIAARSEIQSALADASAMRAEQRGAQAELVYADAELARSTSLFAKGAVSRDELQQAQAARDKAKAMVDQAAQKVVRSNSMVAAARSMSKQADAELVAAARRVQKAEAMVSAKDSMVGTATSEARAAQARIQQEQAMAAESAAGLQGASAQLGFATLKAPTEGVILKRIVSPGQLVSAGQPILRVAQVSPIRVQANVAEADLSRIQVGSPVKIQVGSRVVVGQVGSVSPGVDPSSRTGVVEAVLGNRDLLVRPGQFVSMEISVGASRSRLTVPRSAIRTDSGGSSVFVTKAEAGGLTVVHQRQVELGESAADKAAVISGLSAGENVVLNPSPDLREAMRVAIVPSASATVVQEQTILVTESGYEPSSVAMPAGKPLVLVFIRKADPSCGDSLSFPSLGIERKLPLNVPVRVEIPAQKAGTVRFACSMDMYKGTVVVR